MSDPAFLLDSNICIYILEGRFPALRDRAQRCSPGQLVTSSIVFAEILRGIRADDHARNRHVEALFVTVPVLPFDAAAGARYREVPFRRGSFDRLIGAHALALDLTLVTANEADFADIPGLRVENWTRA